MSLGANHMILLECGIGDRPALLVRFDQGLALPLIFNVPLSKNSTSFSVIRLRWKMNKVNGYKNIRGLRVPR